MTFHADYWVATAAAAPVIALAGIISISDALRLGITVRERSWPITASRYLATLNVALQAFVLTFSLQSLAQEHNDVRSITSVTYFAVGGLFILVLNTVLLGGARADIARSAREIEQRKNADEPRRPGSKRPRGPDTNEDAERDDDETEDESP